MKDYTFTNILEGEKDIFEDNSYLDDFQFNLSTVRAFKDNSKYIGIAYNHYMTYIPKVTGILTYQKSESKETYSQLVSPCVPLLLYQNRAQSSIDSLYWKNTSYLDFLLPGADQANEQNAEELIMNQKPPQTIIGYAEIEKYFEAYSWTTEKSEQYFQYQTYGRMDFYANSKGKTDETTNKIKIENQTLNFLSQFWISKLEELNSIPFDENMTEKKFISSLIDHLNSIINRFYEQAKEELEKKNFDENSIRLLNLFLEEFENKKDIMVKTWEDSLGNADSQESKTFKAYLALVFSQMSPEMASAYKSEKEHMKSILGQNLSPLPLLYYAARFKSNVFDVNDTFSGILGEFNQFIHKKSVNQEQFMFIVDYVNQNLINKIFIESDIIFQNNPAIIQIRNSLENFFEQLSIEINNINHIFNFLNEDENEFENLNKEINNKYLFFSPHFSKYKSTFVQFMNNYIQELCFSIKGQIDPICDHFHRNQYVIAPLSSVIEEDQIFYEDEEMFERGSLFFSINKILI